MLRHAARCVGAYRHCWLRERSREWQPADECADACAGCYGWRGRHWRGREPRPLLARKDVLVPERERVQERVWDAERDWLEVQMEERQTPSRRPIFSRIACRGSRSRPAAVSACSEGTTSIGGRTAATCPREERRCNRRQTEVGCTSSTLTARTLTVQSYAVFLSAESHNALAISSTWQASLHSARSSHHASKAARAAGR